MGILTTANLEPLLTDWRRRIARLEKARDKACGCAKTKRRRKRRKAKR